MPDHDLEKLLGGFAADTLTPEEKQQLYSAALQNQHLFDAIANEQALKELLSDPAVRNRLLQSLQTTSSATGDRSCSWFGWFRHPVGLSWAGGIAGAVLAVVLGTQVYQESLRQEAQLPAREDAQPLAPPGPIPTPPQLATAPTNESPVTSAQKSHSSLPPLRETLINKTPSKTPASSTTRDERRTPGASRSTPAPQAKTDPVLKQTDSSTELLSKSAGEPSSSAPQPIAPAAPPSHSAPVLHQSQSDVDGTMSSQERTAPLSARSIFYGTGPQGSNRSIASDTHQRERAASKSAQYSDDSKHTPQSLAMVKSKRASPLQPVGIRYSVSHTEQREHRQDGAIETAPHIESLELTIESNQEGYLQLWKHNAPSIPQLLFPITETEQPRSKLTAHFPLTISVPSTPGILVIRFSRTDTAPSVTFDRTLLDDSTRHQLRESVLTDEISNSSPPIHYVVNQDPSLLEIIVYIAPSQP